MSSRDRSQALQALVPIAIGHAASVALAAGAVALGLSMDRVVVQALAGVLLVVVALCHLSGRTAIPTRHLANNSVEPISRNDVSYTTARIRNIPSAAWNQMDVTMHYRLSRHFSGVDANIEPFHCTISRQDFGSLRVDQSLNRAPF